VGLRVAQVVIACPFSLARRTGVFLFAAFERTPMPGTEAA